MIHILEVTLMILLVLVILPSAILCLFLVMGGGSLTAYALWYYLRKFFGRIK